MGKRIPGVDEKNIARWMSYKRHVAQVRINSIKERRQGDPEFRPKQRQGPNVALQTNPPLRPHASARTPHSMNRRDDSNPGRVPLLQHQRRRRRRIRVHRVAAVVEAVWGGGAGGESRSVSTRTPTPQSGTTGFGNVPPSPPLSGAYRCIAFNGRRGMVLGSGQVSRKVDRCHALRPTGLSSHGSTPVRRH